MTGVLTILGLLVVLLIVSTQIPPFKSYWEGFLGKTGEFDAERFERWRAQRRARRAARREALQPENVAGIDAGEPVRELPWLSAMPVAKAAFEGLPISVQDINAAVVAVGAGADGAIPDETITVLGERGLAPALVGPHANNVSPRGFRLFSGDFTAQLASAMAWAAAAVREDRAGFVAVVLRVPLTGSWHDDADLDLADVFSSIFAREDCPIVLVYEEPLDVSVWPSEVFLETPLEPAAVIEKISEARLKTTSPTRPLAVGRSVRLDAELAARFLMMLASVGWAGQAEDVVAIPASSQLPPYASYIALAVRSSRPWDLDSGLLRETTVAAELQQFMLQERVRLTGIQPDAQAGLLPLTPYRGTVTAWRRASATVPTDRVRGLLDGPASVPDDLDHEPAVARLRQAVLEGDEALAAATLARHGRAWIETPRAADYVSMLTEATDRFPRESAASLWAHYLAALDSALRLEAPAAEWFDDETCRLAQAQSLEALFRAERMEFTRLRGDLRGATQLAADVIPLVGAGINQRDAGTVYADATARYVYANLLRRGGRYDIARRYIEEASNAYNVLCPSHAVEALHCRYALAVCDAIDGVPRVDPLDVGREDQLVFARSLVTLSNAQASWFVRDFERARQFASDAQSGFARIAYRRYSDRAATVGELLDIWIALEAGHEVHPSDDPRIRAVHAAISDTTESLDLADLRPSACLTVLAFGIHFSPNPAGDRRVTLPDVVACPNEEQVELVALPRATSLVAADALLRAALGVGSGRLVPLVPD